MGYGKDWSGIKNGKLIFLTKTKKQNKFGQYLWKAVCDCGRRCTTIARLSKKSCSKCKWEKPIKDFAGQRNGKILYLRPTNERSTNRGVLWEGICDCGKQVFVHPLKKAKSCGCVRRKYHPIISSAKSVWRSSYNDIDFDTFFQLSQQNCDYCGSPPKTTTNSAWYKNWKSCKDQLDYGNFTYNGLDRIDSSKGHTIDNVITCCVICNRMKLDHKIEFFKQHILKICNNMHLK